MISGKRILLKPIGFVKTNAVGDEVKNKNQLADIVLNKELTEALEGIEEFSHLFVLFWLSEITSQKRQMLRVHPRGREDLPLLGIFATRTKLRPNPIGLTLVELVKAAGNTLTVRGLDAFDRTPVIDIKPFDPWDMVQNARVPSWWAKLDEEKKPKSAAS
jgi:tRNA-Thr(GGU) m(6)t(6)A37 methyltransferase TsaA